jgi:hypothetical protein
MASDYIQDIGYSGCENYTTKQIIHRVDEVYQDARITAGCG